MPQLIGIFGGTFDPIHQGHLQSIKLLDLAYGFDRMHWVLSARPPHKDQVSASIEHRFQMLKLALRDEAKFYADDTEIKRSTKSYTFDTIERFEQRFPTDTLCLIVGGDSLQKLHTWYRYLDLLERVNLIVLHRPGYVFAEPDYLKGRLVSAQQLTEFKSGKLVLFRQPEFDISSTQIRQAILEDLDTKPSNTKSSKSLVQQFVAPTVIDYIYQHQLYKKV